MAKNKKSKILAMALCASVMTGIYAAPVMAAELWHNNKGTVVTDNAEAKNKVGQIKTLEGLKEIKVGTTTDGHGLVKVSDNNGGLVRVGESGGRNVRVASDGIYLSNKNGVDKTSGLTVGALTLEGNRLTSAQLANINSVIGESGAITASSYNGVTLAKDGNKVVVGGYNVAQMSTDIGGIRRAGTTDENRSTYIEKTVRVNNNSGLVVYAEDGTTFAAQIDREGNGTFTGDVKVDGNVLTEGVGRFGAFEGPNVRMENGVLTVNSIGETDVAKLDAQGLTLTSGATEATLSAEQIARLNTVVTQNGESIVVTADHFKNTNNSFAVAGNGAVRAADGKFKVGAKGDVAIQYADDGDIVADTNGFDVKKGSAQIVVNNSGIGMQSGTSQVVVNSADGAVFTNGEGNGETVINGGRITTGTVNGVAIGMNGDGDITLGDDIVFDDKFNSGNVAGITRKPPLDDSAPGGSNTTFIEQNTAISADGIVVKDPGSGVSTKTKYNGFYVKDEYGNNVSSLKNDGLRLTDQESGKQTLNATDIADIKGIDRSGNDTDGYKTTIEDATSFTKDGMVTSNITTGSFKAGVTGDSFYRIDATGEMLFRSGNNYIGMDRGRIGFTSGTESVTINGDGTTFTSGDSTTRTTTRTVIKGGTITTETLNVEKIVLGDKIVNKGTGEVIGGELEIGADGSIKIDDAGTDAVEFNATKTELSANYSGTSLNMNSNGFNLKNGTGGNAASLVLNGSGFAFAGPVHLGDGTQVKFSHNETDISLSSLVNRVENLEQKTKGISFDETTGSTTIADKVGTDGVKSNNSMTVGNNGTTFENGTDSKTNINGGAIDADSSSIGNDVSGGSGSGSSGSGSSGMTGNGTYTDSTAHSGQFADADSSYEFTNDANGFTGTVTGDNTSASSGVGIGNDGAFISDSVTDGDISHTVNGGDITNTVTDGSITDTVTNGDMTVTEVKDQNGSATTVEDANGNSTVVSQNINGQTVSTGNGTSVNTGNDFGVTDTDTGKSIYMSDIGHVEDIDSEIQNSDGSKTTVVDAVNNEAEIRRNEIERVDGRINNLENRVGKLEDRVDKVGAMSAAIANLRTMGYDPAAPTEIAVGVGQYRSETGAALGLFHYPNRDFMLSLSVSTSGDEVMGGIGATWKFGRKSPEKVAEIKKAQAEADARRAEEAKLAKAEEMKQAAKEAKIKAQQERHAKLAAELAAQAEAAK